MPDYIMPPIPTPTSTPTPSPYGPLQNPTGAFYGPMPTTVAPVYTPTPISTPTRTPSGGSPPMVPNSGRYGPSAPVMTPVPGQTQPAWTPPAYTPPAQNYTPSRPPLKVDQEMQKDQEQQAQVAGATKAASSYATKKAVDYAVNSIMGDSASTAGANYSGLASTTAENAAWNAGADAATAEAAKDAGASYFSQAVPYLGLAGAAYGAYNIGKAMGAKTKKEGLQGGAMGGAATGLGLAAAAPLLGFGPLGWGAYAALALGGAAGGGGLGWLGASGKGENQIARDAFRADMIRKGLVDDNFNLAFDDGTSYNIGRGKGKSSLQNIGTENTFDPGNQFMTDIAKRGTRDIYQMDFSDPELPAYLGLTDPMARILGGGGGKLTDDIGGTMYNALRTTGGNSADKARQIYGRLGIDLQSARDAINAQSDLTPWERLIHASNVNKVLDPNADKNVVDPTHGEGWINPAHRAMYEENARAKGVTGPVIDAEGYVIDPTYTYRWGRGSTEGNKTSLFKG